MSKKEFYSKILGVGGYLPPKVVTNHDLTTLMDTSDEWIQQRTGIQQRHWVDDQTTTSDLALEASRRALASAKTPVDEIDMIFLATISPDHDFPGTACFLQAKLGRPGIPAIDVRQQCSGFLYALSMADQYVKSGAIKKGLVVGAEVHSKGLDKTPRGRDVGVLFGDGAGAVVVGSVEGQAAASDAQIFSTHLHTDGTYAKELWLQSPGMGNGKVRIENGMIERGEVYPSMNGKTVFVHATKKMPEAIHEALTQNRFKIEDVDLFMFHQANIRINEMVAKQLQIPSEKVFNTIQKYANTTAATIPLGLAAAVDSGKLKPGMLVASAAFGSGFTWASALFRW